MDQINTLIYCVPFSLSLSVSLRPAEGEDFILSQDSGESMWLRGTVHPKIKKIYIFPFCLYRYSSIRSVERCLPSFECNGTRGDKKKKSNSKTQQQCFCPEIMTQLLKIPPARRKRDQSSSWTEL